MSGANACSVARDDMHWASQIATQRQSIGVRSPNYDLLGSDAYGHPIFGIETC
jgi:hypothetical protein